MRKFKLLLLVAMVASMAFSSCKKYEEGPSLTLRSRESRLAREWKVSKSLENGAAQTINTNDRWKFEKGGTYTFTTSYPIIGTVSSTGTWKFTSDDEKISITLTNPLTNELYTDEWTIMRLSSKELFVESNEGNDLYRIELESVD